MSFIPRGRRKQMVVDTKFQWRAALIGILYIAAIGLCLALPLFNMMQSTNLLLEGRSEELVGLYRGQQNYTIISLVVFFVGISLAWTFFTIWRTHKVAGPIVKITRHIHGFATGNFSQRIHLRAHDEMQALANSLNDMAQSLENREAGLREDLRRRIELTKQRIFSSPTPDGATTALDELAADVENWFGTPARPQESGQASPHESGRETEHVGA